MSVSLNPIAIRHRPTTTSQSTTGGSATTARTTTSTGYSGESTFETNSVGKPAHTTPTGARLEKLIRQTFNSDLAVWNQRALANGGRQITLSSGATRVVAPQPKPASWDRLVGDAPRLNDYKKGGPKYPLRDFHSSRPVRTTPTGPRPNSLEAAHQKISGLKADYLNGTLRGSTLTTLVNRAFEGIVGDDHPKYDEFVPLMNQLGRAANAPNANRADVLKALNDLLAFRP